MASAIACFSGLAVFLLVSTPLSAVPPDSPAERWLSSIKTPAWSPPADLASWSKQRAEIRQTLWGLLGDLPPRPPTPKVRILSAEEGEGYRLERFVFENGAGAEVPGLCFLPKDGRERHPAILYCHWHGGQYDIGKQELLQTNATPVAAGPALARQGYVVLGIDAYCFGERNGQGPGGPEEKGSAGELTAAKFQLWAGRSLWGMILRDDLMALDYLAARPEVDAGRIGVTGISMGSTRAWWIMALDDRPKCGVCVACMTRYQDLIRDEMLKAHGIYYFVPGLLRHFDTEAVIACAAPRAMLFMTGEKDGGSPTSGVKTIAAQVSSLYRLYGESARFESVLYPDTGHVYLPEMWERAVKWMNANLR